MDRLVFNNFDYNISIRISKKALEDLYRFCNEGYPDETGGILIGSYLDNSIAEVSYITGPTTDSKRKRCNFTRGTKGINKLLDGLWEKGMYYLGEWHFHPDGTSTPSNIDIETMISIARNNKYKCPEPILIIVSGRLNIEYKEMVYLYTQGNMKLRFEKESLK